MTQHLTATHARVIDPAEEERTWPQMDNFFSSPELFDHLIKKLNVVGLSWGNLSKDWGQFASNWMDQTDVCTLTNIHDLPQEDIRVEMAT